MTRPAQASGGPAEMGNSSRVIVSAEAAAGMSRPKYWFPFHLVASLHHSVGTEPLGASVFLNVEWKLMRTPNLQSCDDYIC